MPKSGDYVRVAPGVYASANDEDCDFINNTGVAILQVVGNAENSSALTVTISREETVLNCRIYGATSSGGTCQYTDGLIKEGPGRLRLAPSSKNNYDLHCNFVVNNGVLQLPIEPSYYLRHSAKMTVNKPGVLWLGQSTNGDGQYIYFNDGLFGDGTISNLVDVAHRMRIANNGNTGVIPEFTGVLAGDVTLQCTKGTNILNGTWAATKDVTLFGTGALYLGVIGGGTGDNVISGSAGSGNFVIDGNTSGDFADPTLGYIGSGQTVYATFTSQKPGHSLTFDGGPHGGLDFTGTIDFGTATNATTFFVLTGTNTNECVVSGAIKGQSNSAKTIGLVKRGSGTWKVESNSASTMKGVVAVEEGTLKADVLARAGEKSSLGYSTLLLKDHGGASSDDSHLLPYALLLGTAATRGTLEYTGTDAAEVPDRLIALAGEGALKSDSAALTWEGVTAVDAGAKTLVLGGAAEGSMMHNVTNGPGTVSVVKEGPGSWTLNGTLDFTGGISVMQGSLSISSTNYYSWYRIYLVETKETTSQLDISRIGLFNSDGLMQCHDITTNHSAYMSPHLLRPGEATYATTRSGITLAKFLDKAPGLLSCFLRQSGATPWWRIQSLGFIPKPDDETSRIGCVVRLPADADPVTSYDFGSRWDAETGNPSSTKYTPQSWTVEGSVDGQNWDLLDTVISNRTFTIGYWRKSGIAYYYDSETKTSDPNAVNFGWPIAAGAASDSTLNAGIDNLFVATNATVFTDKTVTTRKITVDASGMGTATGFALAEGGVIDIANATTKPPFAVDVDFSGIELPTSYSFTINQAPTSCRVSISPDGKQIEVVPYGIMIYVK